MKKENEYLKNTIILLIGKFSSQIIAFILLPIYTYKFNTDDYGYVDLLQTYISLLTPIIILQLDSAIFRFLIDVRKDIQKQKNIISSSIVCITMIMIFLCLIFMVLCFFINIKYRILMFANIIVLMYHTIFLSILRGNGKNKDYSIASIITAFFTLISNLFFILLFKLGAESILISSIIGTVLASIYIIIKEKMWLFVKIKFVDKQLIKEMIKYSIPMIPNVLSWWIVGLSDRTMISLLVGLGANGIYTVSCKFSNLLNSIFSIFSMSWQETTSIHINDKDANIFFTKMIGEIYSFFVFLSCIIMGLLTIFFDILIGDNYQEAYIYIPILLVGNIFNVIVGLLGGIYVAKKMTKKVAMTTVASAIINILINIIFIKKFELYAATFSTLIAYLIMLFYRYFDVRKIINIRLNIKRNLYIIILCIINIIVYYYRNILLSSIIILLTVLSYIVKNRIYLKSLISDIILKINMKKLQNKKSTS